MTYEDLMRSIKAAPQESPPPSCDPCRAAAEEHEEEVETDEGSLFAAVCLLDEVRQLFLALEGVPMKPGIRSKFLEVGFDVRAFIDGWDLKEL